MTKKIPSSGKNAISDQKSLGCTVWAAPLTCSHTCRCRLGIVVGLRRGARPCIDHFPQFELSTISKICSGGWGYGSEIVPPIGLLYVVAALVNFCGIDYILRNGLKVIT